MKKHILKNTSLPVQRALICFALTAEGKVPAFTQPVLPYAYNALEPHIDAMTLEIHYSRHHAAYTKGFNDALQSLTVPVPSTAEAIFEEISKYPVAVRNQGGGYYNHNLYWECMSPSGGGEPAGKLAEAIRRDFGSFEAFMEHFSKAGAARFGSGWAWLISSNGKLAVTSTANQDNPLMDVAEAKGTPILCMDVWEHAYYLKYRNKRPDYIQAFWNVVNWKFVSDAYAKTL